MKFRYLVVFAALAFMASCSNQENESPTTVVPIENAEPWVYDESLPVPVDFAAAQIMVESKATSKAAVSTDKGWIGSEVGVFALNRDGGWGETESEDVLMYNTKATVSSQTDRSLTFSPVVYYPMTNDVNFTFYGYYPYSENVSYMNGRRYEVTYENIGNIDILWAKKAAEQITVDDAQYDGFNARYIRQATASSQTDKLPKLQFDHMLTGMTFTVRKAEDGGNIQFKGLTFTNIQPNATLRVADNVEPDEWEGVVVGTGERGEITLKKDEDNSADFSDVKFGTVATSLRATLMLVPAESYTAEIYLIVDGEEIDPVPVTLTRTDGFKKGEMYSMSILIQNPEKVSITSSVTDWVAVTGEEIVIGG